MADATTTSTPTPPIDTAPPLIPTRMMARAFTALRIFTGLVWLSNAVAKVFDKGLYDFGFISFNLVTLGAAQGIATYASGKTPIAALGAFYRDMVLPNWGFFGAFLTVAELAIGLGLIFGLSLIHI